MSQALQMLFDAAHNHAMDAGEDHNVGDLQDLLRAAWVAMTLTQRDLFINSDAVANVLEGGARGTFTAEQLTHACELELALNPGGEVPRSPERIDTVYLPDLLTDTGNLLDTPEAHWIEANASYAHRDNGQDGIHDFILNLACALEDAPTRLAAAINDARRAGCSYLLISQGN